MTKKQLGSTLFLFLLGSFIFLVLLWVKKTLGLK